MKNKSPPVNHIKTLYNTCYLMKALRRVIILSQGDCIGYKLSLDSGQRRMK